MGATCTKFVTKLHLNLMGECYCMQVGGGGGVDRRSYCNS